MSTAGSPSKDGNREHKIFSRHKLRDKLFATDKHDEKRLEDQEAKQQDIALFLGSSNKRAEDRLLNTQLDPNFQSQDGTYVEGADSPPPPKNVYHRAKPRQNKGLQVHFVSTAPEIIGEGGDEAETPANLVSAVKLDVPDFTLSLQASDTADHPDEPPQDPFEDSLPTQLSSARNGAPLRASDQGRKLRRRSVQDIGDVHPIALHNDRSGQDGVPSPESPVSPLSDDGDFDVLPSPGISRENSFAPQSDSPSDPHAAVNSLTPRVSPEPASMMTDERSYGDGRLTLSGGEPSPNSGASLSPSAATSRLNSPSVSSEPKAKSLRKVAKHLGYEAIDEFDDRVNRFYNVFYLGATAHQDLMDISFKYWLRTAKWWFLRGRAELENEVRSRSRSSKNGAGLPGHPLEISSGLKQAYLDLAKAWWIVKEITPSHPDIRRYGNTSVKSMVAILHNFGNRDLADLAEIHVDIVSNLRALAMSMKRNDRLPPEDFELQNLDTRVLFEAKEMPPAAELSIAHHRSTRHAHLSMPLGDSPKFFTFTRMFGKASVVSRSRLWEPVQITCVISLLRLKNTFDLTASIVSPDDSLDLIIQTDESRTSDVTWKSINWSSTGNFISIPMSENTDIAILLTEQDFKSLWSICDYTRKVQKDFNGRRGEEASFQTTLSTFQCLKSQQHASSFPPDPVSLCEIRLFSSTKTFSDGTGRLRAGFRMMARTPPAIKSLSSVSQDYGNDMPTVFGFGRRDETPTLSIRVPGSSTFVLTLTDWEELDEFYSIFTQRRPTADEVRSSPLPLQNMQIFTEDQESGKLTPYLQQRSWQHLRAISGKPTGSYMASTLDRSQHLRLITQGDMGIITDCFGFAPGEMQMSLSVGDCKEISLRRTPQRDLFVTLTDRGLSNEEIDLWRGLLWTAGRSTTIKSYTFHAMTDLHMFESLSLGFDVAFEGVASSFAISRKRKGISLHRQWEATFARIQILRRDKNVQLVAFFRDFAHGSSMNFVLKSTDVFEKSSKPTEHYVRIVDAKFALPKGPEDPARNFVCLETPEYPSEHDDITIGFSKEEDRDEFAGQLPAAVGKASKLSSLKR